MTIRVVGLTENSLGMGPEDYIAYCARVSNPGNQNNTKTSANLLSYLKREAHWSPFEMASATLEIVTTRDIARQMLRHRSFSFQEFSQRYANPHESGLKLVTREARLQDHKNRQNSLDTANQKIHDLWEHYQHKVIDASEQAYQWAIENGIAKEQARAVLPEGLMESKLYMSGTIRSWIHYCDLRGAHGTQKEHIQIAQDCAKALSDSYPSLFGEPA